MLDEGIYVKKDPVAATQYFAHAANMGYPAAALDYAAKVGLGEGTAQNYEGAGNLCHTAGLDPQNQVSRYALGYACTVRGIAGKLLRETLPQGAFRPGTGEALIEFSPSTSQMRVRSTPKVGRGEMATGSNIRRPLVDAQEEIDKAWRDALAQVPKPDAAQLGSQTIEMPLDVDMTLEVGRAPAEDLTLRPLLQSGDVHRTMN
jgi:TPR repeat protein